MSVLRVMEPRIRHKHLNQLRIYDAERTQKGGERSPMFRLKRKEKPEAQRLGYYVKFTQFLFATGVLGCAEEIQS